MPIERAAAILDGGKGTQWDPRIVDAFLRLIGGQTAAAPSPSVLTAAPTG
jgi:HD-GYP domain-containing protein (c-di-GMP phosphodiesterase class II)